MRLLLIVVRLRLDTLFMILAYPNQKIMHKRRVRFPDITRDKWLGDIRNPVFHCAREPLHLLFFGKNVEQSIRSAAAYA